MTPERIQSAERSGEPPEAVQTQPATQTTTWTDALLRPWSFIPLIVGAYLLATLLGLPPAGRSFFPVFGAVLVGVGLGRVLSLRTGRRAFFLPALGAGMLLAAALWSGAMPWWLVLAGIVVITVGLTRLRRPRPNERVQ
jgi:hypothetical protein